jgi:hypothetical protein
MREAAGRFNLSAEILVRRWLDVYNCRSGRSFKHAMRTARSNDKAKKCPPLTDKELEKLSPEELRAAGYLRAENAVS